MADSVLANLASFYGAAVKQAADLGLPDEHKLAILSEHHGLSQHRSAGITGGKNAADIGVQFTPGNNGQSLALA